MVTGYYVFVFVFGYFASGFVGYLGSVAVGAVSYVWFLAMTSNRLGALLVDVKDLAMVLSVYYFIAFLVIFMDWQTSVWFGTGFGWIKLVMSASSVVMWTGIWMDFYRQRVKGAL